MDSQNEEISSIFERFRHYLLDDKIDVLLNEFHVYEKSWSKNKFRMFLTNVLVVMRTWADNPPQIKIQQRVNDEEEDWDKEDSCSNQSSLAEKMKNSSQHLFFSIIDYLQSNSMSTEEQFDVWKRIMANKWTINEKFYIHLSDEHISLPNRLTTSLHNELYDFYMATCNWSSSIKCLLIDLGFTYLLIYDTVFLGCNHVLIAQNLFKLDDYLALLKHSERNPMIYQRKLITAMNTPVKMKFFLEQYPTTDLNELIPGNSELYQQRTPLTIFDRLLKMDVHYYKTLAPFPIKFQPDFTSTYLTNQTANILYLFQKLILDKAKISIALDGAFYQNHNIPFFVSTLGFYLLANVRFRDVLIIPSSTSFDDDETQSKPSVQQQVNLSYYDTLNKNYFNYLIKRSSTFSSTFRKFFFQYFNVSCAYFYTDEFIRYYKSIQNQRLKILYDELIENRTFLSLKQLCRLKIKETIRFYPTDIRQLRQLPLTLQYYLSFDLLQPDFAQILLEKFQQVDGRIKPGFFDELQFHEHNYDHINAHQDWEDQVPEDIDYENEGDEDNDDDQPIEYDQDDADLFDEEGLYSDNDDFDDDEW